MSIMLQIENLSARVTDDDLIVRIGDYATVEAARVDRFSSTTSGKRSARVLMPNIEEAQAAIDWLHDTQFVGSTISVARGRSVAERARVGRLGPRYTPRAIE